MCFFISVLAAVLCSLSTFAATAENSRPFVIPELKTWEAGKGDLTISGTMRIAVPSGDEELLRIAGMLAEDWNTVAGFRPEIVTEKGGKGDIVLEIKADKKLNKLSGGSTGSYSLDITDRVRLSASTARGVYWGTQTLLQMEPGNMDGSNEMALACAVGYPFGVIGVILAVIVLKSIFGGRRNGSQQKDDSLENTFVAEYHVSNPAVFGRSIKEIMPLSGRRFVISRVWKDGKVSIPTSDTVIDRDDHLLIISGKHDVDAIRTLFGDQENTDWNKKDIDWNSIDSELVSRHVLVTKPSLNGVKLGSLRLRNSYGINITRVNRAGIDLLASPSLRLQLGDKLTIVGETKAIDNVATILGNQEKQLRNPNLFAIFIGLAIGLVIGSIPFTIPGISMPVKLGLAGGPIITGILMGAFGPRFHLSIYTTRSANLMLRQLGLIIYLAGLGLGAGKDFFETVFRTEGLVWIAVSFALAVVPVLVVGFISMKWAKTDYAGSVGMLCGSMANPIALDYANSTVEGDEPSVAYATVYPFSIFLRVISIQIILLVFG